MSSIGYGRAVAAATAVGSNPTSPITFVGKPTVTFATANACFLTPVLDTSMATPC